MMIPAPTASLCRQVRAKGVGAALIEAVYAAAHAQGASKVYWMTQEFNYRARGLYDKMGQKSHFIVYEGKRRT
jgi:GNAT superfamily N-acetyltransferase